MVFYCANFISQCKLFSLFLCMTHVVWSHFINICPIYLGVQINNFKQVIDTKININI